MLRTSGRPSPVPTSGGLMVKYGELTDRGELLGDHQLRLRGLQVRVGGLELATRCDLAVELLGEQVEARRDRVDLVERPGSAAC